MSRLVLFTVVLVIPATIAHAQDKRAVVKQVFDAWKARRTMVKSVRYAVVGSNLIPKGSIENDANTNPRLPKYIPTSDVHEPYQAKMTIEFVSGRYRFEKSQKLYHMRTDSLEERQSIDVYDGKELWTEAVRNPGKALNPGAADVGVATGNLRAAVFGYDEWPFFIAHGFVPMHDHFILPGRFDPEVDEADFYEHGRAKHAGRDCVVLRTEAGGLTGTAVNEYWVDLARGGAVLRQVFYSHGTPAVDVDIRYQQTAGGWLPASWTVTHSQNGKTWRVNTRRVEACEPEVEVRATDFQIELKPGQTLRRVHFGGDPRAIKSPSTASDEKFAVGQNGKLTRIGGSFPAASSLNSWKWWLATAVVLTLSMLVGYRVIRSRAASGVTPDD